MIREKKSDRKVPGSGRQKGTKKEIYKEVRVKEKRAVEN